VKDRSLGASVINVARFRGLAEGESCIPARLIGTGTALMEDLAPHVISLGTTEDGIIEILITPIDVQNPPGLTIG